MKTLLIAMLVIALSSCTLNPSIAGTSEPEGTTESLASNVPEKRVKTMDRLKPVNDFEISLERGNLLMLRDVDDENAYFEVQRVYHLGANTIAGSREVIVANLDTGKTTSLSHEEEQDRGGFACYAYVNGREYYISYPFEYYDVWDHQTPVPYELRMKTSEGIEILDTGELINAMNPVVFSRYGTDLYFFWNELHLDGNVKRYKKELRKLDTLTNEITCLKRYEYDALASIDDPLAQELPDLKFMSYLPMCGKYLTYVEHDGMASIIHEYNMDTEETKDYYVERYVHHCFAMDDYILIAYNTFKEENGFTVAYTTHALYRKSNGGISQIHHAISMCSVIENTLFYIGGTRDYVCSFEDQSELYYQINENVFEEAFNNGNNFASAIAGNGNTLVVLFHDLPKAEDDPNRYHVWAYRLQD